MGAKEDLKNIIRGHLSEVASSIFIDRSLSDIDQSADNKESYLAAADKVSKKIALFIDTDLALKVFDSLKMEIRRSELNAGTRRKYVRVPLSTRVNVTYKLVPYELTSENISEGGIYIKTAESLAVGSEVKISLDLEAGWRISLKGLVVHINSNTGKYPPGMGIEFKDVSADNRSILSGFVKKALAMTVLRTT